MSKQITLNKSHCDSAIRLKNDLETGFLSLAEHLYLIKTNTLWQGVYGSWSEFTMELKMSANSINKLIQIHSTFVVEYKIPVQRLGTAGGFSLVADILPVIKSAEDAEHWLTLAETLTRSDLRKELKEAITGTPLALCQHKHCNKFEVCEDCGEHFFIG